MRRILIATVAPVLVLVGACNPFANSDNATPAATPTATEVSEQPASGDASTTTASGDANSNVSGKPSAGDSTTSTRMAANDGTTDRKGEGNTGNSNRCSDNNNRQVVVINDTSTTMRELYGSNVNRTTWEEDVLGTRVLPGGERINVNWDDGSCECNFDFKAVFMDGTETVRRGFNVCREAQWRIVE